MFDATALYNAGAIIHGSTDVFRTAAGFGFRGLGKPLALPLSIQRGLSEYSCIFLTEKWEKISVENAVEIVFLASGEKIEKYAGFDIKFVHRRHHSYIIMVWRKMVIFV